MRVLHLIDQASPQAGDTTLALLATSLQRLNGVHQDVMLLGGTSFGEAAERAGIANAFRINVPRGSAVFGLPTVNSVVRQMKQNGTFDQFDVIHCWSIASFALAVLLFRNTPRFVTLTCAPTSKQIRWMRSLAGAAAGGTAMLPISNTIRRELLMHGIDESNVHVLRPAIDMAMVPHGDRDRLRESWSIDESTRMIALLGDPVTEVDSMDVGMALILIHDAMLDQPDPAKHIERVCLLVHPDFRHRIPAKSMVDQYLGRKDVIVEPQLSEPWKILPGCDIAINMECGGGGLSLLWAMAANVPIVAEASYAISEIVEDRHSCLLVKPGQTKALAHRVTQLLEDQHQAWSLRDQARNEAFSFFSANQYCQNLKLVYEQMIEGQPIKVPDLQVTGGLRFSGRA